MRALVVPFSYSLDDLALVHRAAPGAPQAGQVLVQVKAVSLNYRDLLVATGHDRWRPPTGRIPGSDAAGEVIAVGDGVTRFAVGDRVITTILPNWISGPLTSSKREGGVGGPDADGVMVERLVLDQDKLVRAPSYLDDVQASTLPTAALTAWHAITRADALGSGNSILVGGTGGVSLFALQIGVAAGASVLVTSSSASKLDRVRELWGASGVNYATQANWADDIVKLTGGRGVDLAIDIGGAASLNESIRATAINGVVAVVGLVGGLSATINLAEIFQRNLRLDGIETGSRDMLEAMIAWFDKKRILPVIDRVFPAEDVGSAFRHVQAGGHFGKVCVTF